MDIYFMIGFLKRLSRADEVVTTCDHKYHAQYIRQSISLRPVHTGKFSCETIYLLGQSTLLYTIVRALLFVAAAYHIKQCAPRRDLSSCATKVASTHGTLLSGQRFGILVRLHTPRTYVNNATYLAAATEFEHFCIFEKEKSDVKCRVNR
jgi:hypothetical protein